MDKNADPTNPILKETIQLLEKQEADIWNKVAENLGKVNRKRPEVNLSDIERNTEEGDTVVVPGKVLGSGRITKEVTVSAFKISNSARNHVEEKGDFEYIRDLIEQNPEGENIQILV